MTPPPDKSGVHSSQPPGDGESMLRTSVMGVTAPSGLALFQPVNSGRLTRHEVYGFERAVPGICYEGQRLRGGFPVGGLGTGYLELRGDGTLGRCSILNEFAQPRKGQGALLCLRRHLDQEEEAVRLEASSCSIHVLGHFPVLNVRYGIDGGPTVWLRAFSPVIPGSLNASNIPGAVLEVAIEGEPPWSDGYLTINLRLGKNPFDAIKRTKLEHERLAGGRLLLMESQRVRSDLFLCWQRCPTGSGVGFAGEDDLALSLYAPLRGNVVYRCVLGWHTPWFTDGSGQPYKQRYTQRFEDAPAAARYLARHYRALLGRILRWQREVFDSGEPDWITHAMVQSLYTYARNSFWVCDEAPDRWYDEPGLFAVSQSLRGTPFTEPITTRQHGHLPTLLLWPELERSTLTALLHYQRRDGEIPAGLGVGASLQAPRYRYQHALASAQFIQQIHRYTLRTGDEELLKRYWADVVDAMHFALSLDFDGDGLLEETQEGPPPRNGPNPQFYDRWAWRGTGVYTATTWLASLRALGQMARRLGDEQTQSLAEQTLQRGQTSLESRLWNGKYFNLWAEPDPQAEPNPTCLANQLMGQFCCRLADLPPLFDPETIRAVYQSIERHNAQVTAYGLVNGGAVQVPIDPSGVADPTFHEQASGIFWAENLCAAMTGMWEGYENAEHWARRLVWAIHEHAAIPWSQPSWLDSRSGLPARGVDYYGNLVVWALPMARKRIGLPNYSGSESWLGRMVAPEEDPAT